MKSWTPLIATLLLLSHSLSAETLRLHPRNPHYFLFHGKAVALISSGEHYGAVLNADFDYHRYLAALQADGLNYTRLFGGSYIEVPVKSFGILRNDLAPHPQRFIGPWARSEQPGYAGGGNKFDLENWNPEYFKRYRDFLTEADQRGVVVEITLFSSHYNEVQWNLSPFNPSNNVNSTNAVEWRKLHTLENGNILQFQERYARKLVSEANGFENVIFEIQNEPWSDRPTPVGVINPYLPTPGRDTFPNLIEVADTLSLAWQTRVAVWITTEESDLPNKHLIAQNYSNFVSSVKDPIQVTSVLNFHYAYPETVAYNYGLDLALSYDETGFLGRADSSYLRQAWNFMLAGGSAFGALDYSFSPGHENGDDVAPNGPGGGSPTFRHQLHILNEFLHSFPLEQMHPDVQVVKHAPGLRAHALSDFKNQFAFYFDGSGPAQVVLLLPSGHYAATWINPETGTVAMDESFQHSGGPKTLVSPAFEHGEGLRLVRASTPVSGK